jgi:hypothetical protein
MLEGLLFAWLAPFLLPPIKNREGAKLSRGLCVAIEARTAQPTELPILEAVVSIIRRCDLFATPHQITFLNAEEVPLVAQTEETVVVEQVRFIR